MNDPREFVGRWPTPLFFKHVLRKIFLEDWHLKLTALMITLALWYGVSVSTKKGTAIFDAKLSIQPPVDAVVMNQSRQVVRISVSGNDRDIAGLYGRGDLNVTADLTQTETGERIVQLTPQTVRANLPTGLKLEDIQPNSIAVTLEPLSQKDMPVEPALTGEPAPGYEIYSITATPAYAQLTGPKSFIDTLDSVPTGPIDISGAKSNVVEHQVRISIKNPLVITNSDIVDVNVSIGEKRVERMFVLTVAGKRVTATVYGPRSVVAKLKPTDLKVEIVKGDQNGDVAQVTLPESARSSVEVRDVKLR
jgi:YbbR domain-containing protein